MTIRERLIEKRRCYCNELVEKTVEQISEEFLKIFDRDMTVNSIKRKIVIRETTSFYVYIVEEEQYSTMIIDVNSLDILEEYKGRLIEKLREEGISCTPISPSENSVYEMEIEIKMS